MRHQVVFTPACLMCAVLTVGCGGSGELPTAAVTGKVTFEGDALAGGGSIRFVPANGEGKGAGGTIDAEGNYTLSTYGVEDGAILGDHRVEITQNVILAAAEYAAAPEGEEPQDLKPTKEEVSVPEDQRIPEVYSAGQSPLTATVKDGEDNVLNFELKRTP